ncbi:hypothetical protein RS130_10130 [Paraglaciecola aquimarina]|uniref:PEP-CTERM sorting domain-containing protein n=1 Tax=Paraglaciecola aquimarina TaxID=1235557 RepID=A0ABU3SW77_9ALTE|nr:hypothetical protein [Paraglaciecola aquimarina]MDU0354243.1 hypothetical protein [Paraglaciecola aquimarina]
MKHISKKLARSFVLASALLVSAFSTQAALVLSFDQTNIAVDVSDTFTVDLYVDALTPSDAIIAWGLDAVFDNGVIALNSFSLGTSFLPGFSADSDTLAGNSPIPSGVFGADILLGSFEFLAVGAGTTTLSTATTSGDIFEGFTTVDFFNPAIFNSASTSITVADSGSVGVSAPATLAIFSFAAIFLMGWARKS